MFLFNKNKNKTNFLEKDINKSLKNKNPSIGTEDKILVQKMLLKKKQNKKNIMLIFLLLFTIILTYFAIKAIFGSNKNLYQLSFITQDSIYNTIESKALIARQEFLLTSDVKGKTIPLASEGTQLAYGTKISLLVKENIEQLQQQLQQVEKQIAKRQDRLIASGEGKEASQIFARYDDQLRQQAKLIAQLKVLGFYSGLNQIENYIKSLLEARSIRLNKLELTDVVLTDLLKERVRLIRQIEEKSKTYFLPEPGLISYSYDNLETELSINNIINLPLEKIFDLLDSKNEYKSVLSENDNDIIARLVYSPKQFLAFYLSNEDARNFVDNSSFDLFVPEENLDIDGAKIVKRLSDDDRTIFIVETHTGLTNLLNKRQINILIKSQKSFGYKVQNEAIEKINNSESPEGFLTVINNGQAKKVRVEILISNNYESIIKAKDDTNIKFDVGSVVILNAENIRDGDEVE